MTWSQLTSLRRILDDQDVEFHHGCCEGADTEAHLLANALGLSIVCHPPLSQSKQGVFPTPGDAFVWWEPKEYLVRNRDIVEATTLLIACPAKTEVLRSGTWATVRYARKRRHRILIVHPDGVARDDQESQWSS